MRRAALAVLALLPAVAHAVDTADLSPGTVELAGAANLRLETGTTRTTPSGGTETKTDRGSYVLDASGFYYLARSVGLGLTISYDKESEKTEGTSTDTWALVIGPAISLHFPVASELAIFGRGAVGGAWARTWGGSGQPDVGGSGYGYLVEAGLKYFPLKQLSLDAGVKYQYLKLTTDEVTYDSGTTPVTIPKTDVVTSGLAFVVGLSVYFGR